MKRQLKRLQYRWSAFRYFLDLYRLLPLRARLRTAYKRARATV